MKKLLTLALALVTLALAFATTARRGTGAMAKPQIISTTRTITLNTGYDQWATPPARINIGEKDNEWRVITDPVNNVPDPTISTGRPADVVIDTNWQNQQGNFPNSRWISITPNQGAPLPPAPHLFQYAFYFTLPPGASNPELVMSLSSDDRITQVTLNNIALPLSGPGNFQGLPATSGTTSGFTSGSNVNVLIVDVEDTHASKTGLIVDGVVTYQDCDRRPIRNIPNLTSITFWESTFAQPTQHTFAAGGLALTTRLTGALGTLNKDFEGVTDEEFYDVFYSNWAGSPDPLGQFVTIEAEWDRSAPFGGGLNIARVDFNGTGQFASSVASFVVLGNNALPSNVGRAVDLDPGTPATDTTMGNTIDQTQQRLRLTVGFPCCASVPAGMVAWWPLDELDPNTGEYVDRVGADNNGIPIGNPSQLIGQYVGNSFQSGIGDYVEVQDAANLNFGLGSFTIDAWVRFTPGTQQEPIVFKQAGQGGGGYFLSLVSQGAQQWELQLQIATNIYHGPIITATQGQWIFVAAAVDKTSSSTGTVTLYAGVPGNPLAFVASAAGAFSASSLGTPLWIGQKIPNPHANLGIDEVEIFNRALTQQPQIQNIFNVGSGGKCHFAFNKCLQDDSNPSTSFLADSVTGDYQFFCGGTTFTGVAQVTKRGNITTFQHNGPDQRVTATIDGGSFKASASLQSPPGTIKCTITDKNTRNNSCVSH